MNKVIMFMCCILCSTICYANVDKKLIDTAEKYLNSITGLQGDFIQTASGKSEKGVFSILRPGRVRLDYDNAPIQLIADGEDLYFYDKSLDQITTVPLTSTPAGILVRKNIDLHNSDINVFETLDNKDNFVLKVNLRDKEGLGSMSITFNKQPVKLDSWTVIDATSNETKVSFTDLKQKSNFGDNYFQLSRHKTINTNDGDSFYD